MDHYGVRVDRPSRIDPAGAALFHAPDAVAVADDVLLADLADIGRAFTGRFEIKHAHALPCHAA